MGNLIDRINAIDAIDGALLDEVDEGIAIDILLNLPSAQPDYKTDHGYMWLCPHCGLPVHSDFEECLRCGTKRQSAQPDIIRCKDCKHYETHGHRCKVWNHGVIVMGYCYRAERRTDD